jgi:hypothetical protein
MRNESWLRLMSGLVLVGVFAAGALFGAGLMRWTAPHGDRLPPPPGMPPGGGPIEAMTRELKLDATQRDKLHEIADAHRGDLEQIARSTQARVRDVLFAMEDELKPSLRPEQIEALEQWRKHRPPPPGPGMGPPPPGPGMPPPPPGGGGPPGGPR